MDKTQPLLLKGLPQDSLHRTNPEDADVSLELAEHKEGRDSHVCEPVHACV